MSSFNATIWFREPPDGVRLASGFQRASKRLGMDVNLSCEKVVKPNSSTAWFETISSFPDYEYTGHAIWEFYGKIGKIRGNITWPIFDPGDYPGTIEFRVRWRKKSKGDVFIFTNLDILVGFFQDLAYATKATRLYVEPCRLPEDILEERIEKFKRLSSQHSLTNIDWICGIRSDDDQSKVFRRKQEPYESSTDNNGFEIFVFSPEPFNFNSDDDRCKVKELEKEFGLV